MATLYGNIDMRQSFLQKDINENVHNMSLIPNPSTERATQWDVLALDTIGFWEFKELINTKSRISFYLVCQSKKLFEIIDRPHHPRASAVNP
jgi:hypothetical protein